MHPDKLAEIYRLQGEFISDQSGHSDGFAAMAIMTRIVARTGRSNGYKIYFVENLANTVHLVGMRLECR